MLLVGIAGAAMFGAFVMSHELGGHDGCIAASTQGVRCPRGENAVLFLNFHSDVLKNCSTAVFGGGLYSLLFTLTAFLALAVLRARAPVVEQSFSLFYLPAAGTYLCSRQETHWLSLHENSLSLVIA